MKKAITNLCKEEMKLAGIIGVVAFVYLMFEAFRHPELDDISWLFDIVKACGGWGIMITICIGTLCFGYLLGIQTILVRTEIEVQEPKKDEET